MACKILDRLLKRTSDTTKDEAPKKSYREQMRDRHPLTKEEQFVHDLSEKVPSTGPLKREIVEVRLPGVYDQGLDLIKAAISIAYRTTGREYYDSQGKKCYDKVYWACMLDRRRNLAISYYSHQYGDSVWSGHQDWVRVFDLSVSLANPPCVLDGFNDAGDLGIGPGLCMLHRGEWQERLTDWCDFNKRMDEDEQQRKESEEVAKQFS
jgi:hypothetical protein